MDNDRVSPVAGVSVRAATPGDSEVIIRLVVALAEFEQLDPPGRST